MKDFALKGDILYSKNLNKVSQHENSYLVCVNGKSEGVFKKLPAKYKGIKIYDYTGYLIIPGLIDMHLHAPQYIFIGLHMDMKLLDWLNTYTFPAEAKYKNLNFAKRAYDIFVNDLTYTSTTRFSMFATIHNEATLYLMNELEKTGFKGYVGKVNMDRNSPKYLIETTSKSIKDTLKWLDACEDFKNIKPIITPRFIPTCTDKLMRELSNIMVDKNLPVQSHLSENKSEIEWVKELMPKVKSYEEGITPNPCIDCNKYMKFEKLYNVAQNLDCNYIATGHYARIEEVNGKYYLKKAVDETKDQSYVLYNLTQEHLAHTLFPLGNLHKTEIRDIAKQNNFINANKPDSQDICFVPNGNYVDAIERFSNNKIKEGNFIDINGKVIGKHKGIVYYTIGQRRGLGCFQKHVYVCRISAKDNTVMLGDKQDLLKKEFIVNDFNWILKKYPSQEFSCCVKIRYKQKEHNADVKILNDNKVRIMFDESQNAITPGQAAVLYDKDIVLGGGTISNEI